MNNAYMRERAADIKDINKRILAHLLGVTVTDPSTIDERSSDRCCRLNTK